ncbi:MAG: CYTH and CHAD domain-containing protein [Pseudomonadota bacterium]
MKEIELKLLVDEAGARRLSRRLTALTGTRPVTRRLLTVYLDTAEGGLAAAGIALRLRREGRGWTQTVKAGRSMRAGLSETTEVNVAVPGGRVDLAAIPDPALRAAVEKAAGGLPLAPVYETDMRRTLWEVTEPQPGMGQGEAQPICACDQTVARIEVALDRGDIHAGPASEGLIEVELELLAGPPATLFALARRLFPEGGLRFSAMNKAERGRRLAAGEPTREHRAPRNARPVPIAADASAEAAGREILAECFAQIADNAAVVIESDDPEGPHQLRVGLRRLRSALELTEPAFSGLAHAMLAAEARWLGQEVGRLRDLDVALVDLVEPMRKEVPAEPGFAALSDALVTAAATERAALRRTLTGARVHGFLFDLAAFIALRGWLEPADHRQTHRLARPFAALAAERLERADRRAAKRAKGIATLEVEARHDLRKSLKKLRYIVEFASPLWSESQVRPMLKSLKALQQLFGDLNDAAVAETLFLAPNGPGVGNPVAARAAGRLIGARNAGAEQAWAEAQARWEVFAAARRPWKPRKSGKKASTGAKVAKPAKARKSGKSAAGAR